MASMELSITTNKNPGVEAGPSFWGWRTLTLCCMLLPFLLFCLVDIGTGGSVVSGSIDYLLTAASIGASATSSVVPGETFLESDKGQPGNALCNLIGFCGTPPDKRASTESTGGGVTPTAVSATGAGGGGGSGSQLIPSPVIGGGGDGAPPAAAAAVRVPRQPAPAMIEQSAAAAGEEAGTATGVATSGSPLRPANDLPFPTPAEFEAEQTRSQAQQQQQQQQQSDLEAQRLADEAAGAQHRALGRLPGQPARAASSFLEAAVLDAVSV